MINLQFSFKVDLVDVSSIDFYFADNFEDLEENPLFIKTYPDEGRYENQTIIMPLTEEEEVKLPSKVYSLAFIHFQNNTKARAYSYKIIKAESAISAALATTNNITNFDFYISAYEPAYKSGDGIIISDENVINVKLQEEDVLEFDEEGVLQISKEKLGYDETLRAYLTSDNEGNNDPYALANKQYVTDAVIGDVGRYSYTVKTDVSQSTERKAYLYSRFQAEGEYTSEQRENTFLVLYNKQKQIIQETSAFDDNIDISQAWYFKIYTTLTNSYQLRYAVSNPIALRERQLTEALNKKQDTLSVGNGINISNDTISAKIKSMYDNALEVDENGLFVSKYSLGYDNSLRQTLINTSVQNPLASKEYVDDKFEWETINTVNVDSTSSLHFAELFNDTQNMYRKIRVLVNIDLTEAVHLSSISSVFFSGYWNYNLGVTAQASTATVTINKIEGYAIFDYEDYYMKAAFKNGEYTSNEKTFFGEPTKKGGLQIYSVYPAVVDSGTITVQGIKR